MIIDENKIRQKAKSFSGGYKGIIPRMPKSTKKTDYMNVIIGFFLSAAMIAGTIILFINLLATGKDIIEKKSTPKKTEYIEVIFKPNKK
ncbi:MAG: hypothetical protein E7035_06020 [Verrucomicrobiaceae bacterium]|jgi:hypothetical protein|nr:hypothetical protein [Verrucomicrobiaceae bacterium]